MSEGLIRSQKNVEPLHLPRDSEKIESLAFAHAAEIEDEPRLFVKPRDSMAPEKAHASEKQDREGEKKPIAAGIQNQQGAKRRRSDRE